MTRTDIVVVVALVLVSLAFWVSFLTGSLGENDNLLRIESMKMKYAREENPEVKEILRGKIFDLSNGHELPPRLRKFVDGLTTP